MFKLQTKAQDFIDIWCTKLRLPSLLIVIRNQHIKNKPGAISIDHGIIILWKSHIHNQRKLILVLLHELSHWFLYWRYKDNRYRDESQVIQLSHLLLNTYYPKYNHA